jgi:hypothetical protein
VDQRAEPLTARGARQLLTRPSVVFRDVTADGLAAKITEYETGAH